jgi:CubicO group peptidase (beta-lactamase class C family)
MISRTTLERVVELMLSAALVSCGSSRHEPSPPPEVRLDEADPIARVEHGLVPLVHVRGEPVGATSLSARMAYYHVPGVSIAVIHDGRIAWAKGYGVLLAGRPDPVTDKTMFEAASISKPVTDLGAMALVQQGTLDLDSSIDRWLTSWHVPAGDVGSEAPPTARMIMSHHAGFNVESVSGYAQATGLPTPLQILRGEPPSGTPPVHLIAPPGKSFQYSGGGLSVLQQALVDRTGTPFESLMKRVVFDPLGITRSTFVQKSDGRIGLEIAHGHAYDGRPWVRDLVYPDMAAAGLRTTPTDLAKIVLELERALQGKGAVLSSPSAREMLTAQFGGPTGLGFFLSGEGARRRFFHDGWNYGFTCRLVAYVETGDGAVVMTNQDTGLLMFEILAAIGQTYGWPDAAKLPREAEAIDAATAERCVGRYAWDAESTAQVMLEGGRLFLKVSRDAGAEMDPFPPAELFRESEASFFSVVPKMSVRFDLAQDGSAAALVHSESEGHETRSLRRQ